MYILDPVKKENPARRWHLPDRIFFGHGACHILAGVYLEVFPDSTFKPFWIKPSSGFSGMHVFVSDGQVAFDYHGYSVLDRLQKHHQKVWGSQYPGWSAEVLSVDFPLLETAHLNQRNMRGPDQYLGDAKQRARLFIEDKDHEAAIDKVRDLTVT